MTAPGTDLAGRYRIERELGAGGMATVYLAHDVRHDRRVALKVLRPDLAAVIGAQRFLAEIRTTANLQHPHILPLYDSGETDGSVFYVMPYVAGESLRDRLNREKQLPVDEAVRVAGEVADALDYAHRQRVVHRDIKPENILLHDGRALVADFGIALAVSRSDGVTRMTETGMSLGTPHYMSPEQAMGEREITPRSDVYALGCVLYEMLTGEPPFTGPTPQAIVARVMTDAPRSITAQRHTVPQHVEDVVRRALEKLPADRFPTAAQFAEALRVPGSHVLPRTVATPRVSVRAGGAGRHTLVLAAVAAVATAMAAWGWMRPQPAPVVSRYAVSFPASMAPLGMMQLSADGSRLLYGGPASGTGTASGAHNAGPQPLPLGQTQLWLKARDRAEPVPVPGTTGIGVFAVSPDAQYIVYVASLQPGAPGPLRKLPVGGGPAVTIADSVTPFGMAWLDDGTIVFSRPGGEGVGLWRISENGGTPERVWLADSTGALPLPSPLPGGRGVLVARYLSYGPPQVWAVDLRSGEAKKVIDAALSAQYVPGYLIYARGDGALLAVPFDARSLEVRGPPIPVMDGVEVSFGLLPQFTVSLDGTLVVRTGAAGRLNEFNAVWVDRAGRQTVIDTAWRVRPQTVSGNVGWALSPDATRLAIGIHNNGNDDIWVKQLPNGPLTRITFDSTSDVRPRWTPDGKALTYVSARAGFLQQLFQKNADGSGRDTLLLASTAPVLEGVWSADRRWLLARLGDETTTSRDIVGQRVGIDTVPVPLVNAPNYNEAAVALSPDGRWLAYESNEAGPAEVFIRPFPNTEAGKWQVSNSGGFAPLWSRDGRELFYVTQRREMVAVTVNGDGTPQLGERRVLFTMSNDLYGGTAENYTAHDVAPDGRFLMMRLTRGDSLTMRMLVVEHLTEELKARSRRP
ncbi:MAG TPA: protein kinase [Gemmatimonadaceae bacterium]|nr:protein kinase [Gemmatimonadaceae bacterium]